MPNLIGRAWRSWNCLPDRRGWLESAVVSLAALATIGVIAFAAGLVHWQPRFDGWPLRLISVMIVPAFAEELVFRGLLIPAKGESRYPVGWSLAGIAAFVVWHVIEATTFLPKAHLFLTAPFLLCAGVLGGACAIIRYRTGSLWPAVLLHGLVVFAWQTALGGPSVGDLL
jgi:predicted Abi (CAAX) family protease